MKKRAQAGWSGWSVSGVICDRMVPARVKGNVYKRVVRPAVLYGLEIRDSFLRRAEVMIPNPPLPVTNTRDPLHLGT